MGIPTTSRLSGHAGRVRAAAIRAGAPREALLQHLQQREINPERIRADTALVEYGLDSIIIVDVTARLEGLLGPLSQPLFFEHLTLASLAAHLVEEHGAALARALLGSATPIKTAALDVKRDVRREDASVRATAPAKTDDTHDIAIIGLSLRVATATDQDAFWEMLSKGLHGVGPVPRARWDHDAIYHPDRGVLGKTVVKTGAFLDDIDKFDPRYFRISQAEAELMSPEVRLFLEDQRRGVRGCGLFARDVAAESGWRRCRARRVDDQRVRLFRLREHAGRRRARERQLHRHRAEHGLLFLWADGAVVFPRHDVLGCGDVHA